MIKKVNHINSLFYSIIFIFFYFLITKNCLAYEIVLFKKDNTFLNPQKNFNAYHYEVSKIIEIDNTTENRIIYPTFLRYDINSQTLLIGDYFTGKILKFSPINGNYLGELNINNHSSKRIIGNPTDILILKTQYLVTDALFNKLIIFNSNGQIINIFGTTGEAYNEFSEPYSLDIYNNNIFIVDRYNCRICVYNLNGTFKYSFASKGNFSSQIYLPNSIKVNNGYVYISDSGNDRIQVFDIYGKHIKTIGQRGKSIGFFNAPTDICFDASSNLYIADLLNERIQKILTNGQIYEIKKLFSSFISKDFEPTFYYKLPLNYDSNEINFKLGELKAPYKIDVNNELAHLYVLDIKDKKIYILDCNNFYKGRKLYLSHNFKDAIKYLKISLDENPDNYYAMYYLGYSYQMLKDYDEAIKCYQNIINLNLQNEVEKYAKLQIKKILAINPPYFAENLKINQEQKQIEQQNINYLHTFLQTQEITAFERKKNEYYKMMGITIPPESELNKNEILSEFDFEDEE